MHSTAALVATLVAAGLAAYWPSAVALFRYWVEEPSLGGHGFLVAGLSAWLLYRARGRVNLRPVRAAPWALLLLVPAGAVALVLWKSGIQSLALLTLPLLIWLAVLAAFGTAVARTVAVPIGYLYFAMPAWNLLAGTLQGLTAQVVAVVAPYLGLPASVSGTSVSFPNGAKFVVTLACSGIGFLTEGLAVAVLIGELETATFARRTKLFLGMIVIALMANWLRVLALVAIGYISGMDNVIVSRRHLEFGYVLFAIILVAFAWLVTRRESASDSVSASSDELAVRPKENGFSAALVALGAPPIVLIILSLTYPAASASTPHMPSGQNAWQGPLSDSGSEWRPAFMGAHDETRAIYEDTYGHRVEALVVGYPTQEQGRELVNEGNSLLGTGELSPVSYSFVDTRDRTYHETLVVDGNGSRSVIWSYYDIEGATFALPVLSQLWYGVRAVGSSPYSALFAFRAQCVPSCADAGKLLERFSRDMNDAFQGTTIVHPNVRAGVWPAAKQLARSPAASPGNEHHVVARS